MITHPEARSREGMTGNKMGTMVVDCAVKLHMELGPGLLESVYEVLLAHRLEQSGLKVDRQVHIPIQFDGIRFDEGFRADLIVEGKVPAGTEVCGADGKGSPKAGANLPEANRDQAWLLIELRRIPDERRHITNPEWDGCVGGILTQSHGATEKAHYNIISFVPLWLRVS